MWIALLLIATILLITNHIVYFYYLLSYNVDVTESEAIALLIFILPAYAFI